MDSAGRISHRHLTQERKRTLIQQQIKDTPQRSDRQIARDLGVSHVTVGAQRETLEDGGQIDHHETTIGSDGVEQPRKKGNGKHNIHFSSESPEGYHGGVSILRKRQSDTNPTPPGGKACLRFSSSRGQGE